MNNISHNKGVLHPTFCHAIFTTLSSTSWLIQPLTAPPTHIPVERGDVLVAGHLVAVLLDAVAQHQLLVAGGVVGHVPDASRAVAGSAGHGRTGSQDGGDMSTDGVVGY